MKITIVSRFPPSPGGTSDYCWHVTRTLADRPEIEGITVIADRIAENEVVDLVWIGTAPRFRVVVDRPWHLDGLALAPRILGAILRTRPDAIWYNLNLSSFGSSARAFAGFLLPAITRKLGLRSVVTLHDLPNQSLAELGFADDARTRLGLDWALAALLQSDVVCVTIRRYQDELLGWRWGNRTEIVHVPLGGYGEPSYEPPTPSPTILMLTAHAPHKNLPLLLNAFASVRPAVPRARLLVAGIDHPRFRGYLSAVRQQSI